MKKRHPVRDYAEYVAFRLVVSVIDALPTAACVRLSEWLAFVVHRLLPRKWTRYQVARENLLTAFGERLSEKQIDHTIHRMWVHLFRVVTEIVQLPRKLRLYNSLDAIDFIDVDRCVRAMCSGRPVILLGGHFGNWEMANVAFGLFGFRTGVVARDLDNPHLHRWFRRWREQTGAILIAKKGGGGEMVDILESRGCLAMLADQDAGKRGLFVPFFGKDASTFKSIALLAMQHNAVICVGYAIRLPDDFRRNRWVRYEMGCIDVIDTADFDSANAVREITERYTASLEAAIRKAPEQYFWVHRRWKSRPLQRRRRKAA